MRNIINFIIISTLTLCSNFCYALPPIKVIIDTDMGLDDWAVIKLYIK